MKYYITTRGRQNKQLTLNTLPKEILKDTWLVVPHGEEGHTYERVIHTPPEITNLALKRQWLIGRPVHDDSKIVLLDDDLNWNVRIFNTTKLRKLTSKEELIPCFKLLEEWMDKIPLVSVSTRQGNNTVDGSYSENTRVLRNFFINLDLIGDARFDRCVVMSDYDFTLQLLRSGKPNRVLYTYSQDQPASNSPGGVSTYRTKEMLEEYAHKLAELHPGFVKLKEKQTKAEWFGDGVRTDVVIYWKKAFKSFNNERN